MEITFYVREWRILGESAVFGNAIRITEFDALCPTCSRLEDPIDFFHESGPLGLRNPRRDDSAISRVMKTRETLIVADPCDRYRIEVLLLGPSR